MDIKFNDSKSFTLGIELEVQLVDSESLALVQRSSSVIDSLKSFKDSVKHELLMSNLEVISKVCADVSEAETDLKEKLKVVIETASESGTGLALASTHPFSRWRDQKVTDTERYRGLLESLQMVGRRFNIFGLHVHVGVDGAEKCIYIMNKMLYYLPHLLAISSNSPFWQGENTGLRSYRTKVFETLPTTGLPFYFHDWSDYLTLVKSYVATGTIKTIRELWWDVRPHPDFGTIEVRVCDIPPTLKEVLSIAALVQAIVKRLSDEFDRGVPFERPHVFVTRENKWRASRYGIDGEFLTKDGASTISVKKAVEVVLDFVEAQSRELGSTEYLQGIEEILKRGTGASRQLRVYGENGSLTEVVRDLSDGLVKEVCG
jgi:carboxylate-amine ligase